MKRTIKQYSLALSDSTLQELKIIAFRYGKVKNYIFSRYGSINGLQYLKYPRKIRDEWVKSGFANEWKLSARYWKLALEEAFSNIKTNWEQTKQSIRDNIRKRDLTKDENHYINYILKSNDLLHKVLIHKAEKLEKFKNINQIKLNKIIKRLVRKYHHKSISKKYKTFTVDSAMYSYKNGTIEIASLTPRERLSISLTDKTVRKGNIKVVLDTQRIELHIPIDVKIKKSDNSEIVGVDKGFRDMLATSNNSFYGVGLSQKLINLSDKLSKKNRQRNKIYALVKKLNEKGDIKKAEKIKKYNLGKKKYNKNKNKIKADIESFVNKSINNFIKVEKPKTVIVEDLSFIGKKTEVKKINRWLSSWLKGYIQERIEFKLSVNSTELAKVNPAYTSQICHKCFSFGKRVNDKFYCTKCGVVNADYNAGANILIRYYDKEISLFTPYKKVKEILLSRLSVSNSNVGAGRTKNRDIEVGDSLSYQLPLYQSDSEIHRNTKDLL